VYSPLPKPGMIATRNEGDPLDASATTGSVE
jgi:hypothetical protein